MGNNSTKGTSCTPLNNSLVYSSPLDKAQARNIREHIDTHNTANKLDNSIILTDRTEFTIEEAESTKIASEETQPIKNNIRIWPTHKPLETAVIASRFSFWEKVRIDEEKRIWKRLIEEEKHAEELLRAIKQPLKKDLIIKLACFIFQRETDMW